jgi:hypothetical protein
MRMTDEALRALPHPIKEAPQHHLWKLCSDFNAQLMNYLKGENDQKDLAMKIAEADRRFLDSVKGGIAQFGLADHDEKQRGVLAKCANDFLFQKQLCNLLISDCTNIVLPEKPAPRAQMIDDDVVDVTPTHRRNLPLTPQKPREPPAPSFHRTFAPLTPPPGDDTVIVYTGISPSVSCNKGEYIELEEVRGMIRREKARKLPGSVSSVLQERLIRRAIATWERCARDYLDEVHQAFTESLTELTRESFGRYTESGLFHAVW